MTSSEELIQHLKEENYRLQQDIKRYKDLLEQVMEQTARLTVTDDLTGLYNRRYFYKKFEEEISKSTRLSYPITLVLMDIDNFKQVNDHFGHNAGDKLLVNLADCTRHLLRKGLDFAFRLGGDEFLLLLCSADEAAAGHVCERLSVEFSKHTHIASISYGMCTLRPSYSKLDLSAVLAEADIRMYQMKSQHHQCKLSEIS